MGYFPFFMDIAGKKGVIVGGGKVAARKVEKLLSFAPRLTVIAPEIEEWFRMQEKQLQKNGEMSLVLVEREFEMADLTAADFVIAATDDEELNGSISEYCKSKQIPVNVVDDREKCSFFFPALVREGNLTIGISTDGKSPVAASWVRKEISQILPSEVGNIVDLMGQIRPRVMGLSMTEADRKAILEKMFLYCLEKDGDVTIQELADRFIRGSKMQVIEYFNCDRPEYWLEQIKKSDWGAGQFLYELLSENKLKDAAGENTRVLMLTNGDELISFCTYAEKDDIQPTELTPWIGFVYTFPKHRGHRYVGELFQEIEKLARAENVHDIYISTNDTGLYEKYGCEFYQMMNDMDGEPSRVYRKHVGESI